MFDLLRRKEQPPAEPAEPREPHFPFRMRGNGGRLAFLTTAEGASGLLGEISPA